MQALITSFKRGRHTITGNQAVAVIDGVETREAAKELIGKSIVWKSSAGKELKGEIRSPHGNKGAVRVLWERVMPGQALGTRCDVE